MAVPPDGVAEVVSKSILILSVLRSKVAFDGSVNWITLVGPAEVAPFVSNLNLFLLKPVSAAVAKATSFGTTCISMTLTKKKKFKKEIK